jgi:hypothetical protein
MRKRWTVRTILDHEADHNIDHARDIPDNIDNRSTAGFSRLVHA